MNCPVCNIQLMMSERQGIEIDYCPQCRGVWLDRGELDKIIERSAQEAPFGQRQETGHSHHDRKHYNHDHDDRHGAVYHHKRRSILSDLFD